MGSTSIDDPRRLHRLHRSQRHEPAHIIQWFPCIRCSVLVPFSEHMTVLRDVAEPKKRQMTPMKLQVSDRYPRDTRSDFLQSLDVHSLQIMSTIPEEELEETEEVARPLSWWTAAAGSYLPRVSLSPRPLRRQSQRAARVSAASDPAAATYRSAMNDFGPAFARTMWLGDWDTVALAAVPQKPPHQPAQFKRKRERRGGGGRHCAHNVIGFPHSLTFQNSTNNP